MPRLLELSETIDLQKPLATQNVPFEGTPGGGGWLRLLPIEGMDDSLGEIGHPTPPGVRA